MGVETTSRHGLSVAQRDPEGRLYLTEREPYTFRSLSDTIEHSVVDGDSWHRIAHRHYAGAFANPERLWWVIADFQPKPVLDPTIAPEVGSIVYVPSPRVVLSQVLSSARMAPIVRSPSLVAP